MGKTKLVAGIILLIIGLGVLPAGLIIDRRINSELDAAIPSTLIGIRDGFIPTATELIKFVGTPDGLLGIANDIGYQLGEMVNATVAANTINTTIFELGKSVTDPVAKDLFFNDPNWNITTGILVPIGISQNAGEDLGFTTSAIDNLLFGNASYPGLITDLSLGSGVIGYLGVYQDADTTEERNDMSEAYNATWVQLSRVNNYLLDYLYPIVPLLGGYPYEQPNDPNYPKVYFLMQWANATFDNDGITLPVGGGIDAWELGIDYSTNVSVYDPSGFSIDLCLALWDESDASSPFNTTSDFNDGLPVGG